MLTKVHSHNDSPLFTITSEDQLAHDGAFSKIFRGLEGKGHMCKLYQCNSVYRKSDCGFTEVCTSG